MTLCRSSPVVDVPEVNSRIALRTIGKSINEDCRPGNSRASNSQPSQNGMEMKPLSAPSIPIPKETPEETKKAVTEVLAEKAEPQEQVVVVAKVQHHSPSLGEDHKTDQRCVSFSYIILLTLRVS